MAVPVIFWAEKLILVINYQFTPRKANINNYMLHLSSIQLSIAIFIGEPADFNRPGLPVDRFSNAQKHFFIKTSNVKGFYLQRRACPNNV
jgi:accessory gene regulator protein AgrB